MRQQRSWRGIYLATITALSMAFFLGLGLELWLISQSEPMNYLGKRIIISVAAFFILSTSLSAILITIANKRAKLALDERDRQFEAIFEKSRVGGLLVDPKSGRFVRVNQALAEMSGYSKEELAQMTFRDLTHPDELSRDTSLFESLSSGSVDHWNHEKRYFRKDGSALWGLASGNTIYKDDGSPLYLLAMVQDVTFHKDYEKALEESEKKYRALFENMAEEVMLWDIVRDENGDIQTWRLMDINPPALKSWGTATREEMIGKSADELFPGVVARYFPLVKKTITERTHFSFEEYFPPPRDKYFQVSGVAYGDKFINTGVDITNIKKAESLLRENETRLRLALSAARLGTLDHDLINRRVKLDARCAEILGVPQQREMSTDLLRELLIPEDRQKVEQLVQKNYEPFAEEIFKLDFCLGKNSEESTSRFIRTTGRINCDENGFATRFIGTIEDITAQKQASQEMNAAREQAEAASKAKSEFLATMSHEIRTPLNAIMGFTDLLIHGNFSESEREDFVQRVQSNGQLLVHLIDDILDLSKIEAGKLHLEKTEMNLREILSDVASIMKFKADHKGIDFTIETVNLLPESLVCDPTRFKQILTNIIGNAIKFTLKGWVRVKVKMIESQQMLIVTVADTGIGLTPEQATNLFQPFTQADSSTTRKFGGTGLGLILSRRLAEALGGTVKLLESRPQKGSIFEISIAVEEARFTIEPRETQKFSDKQSLIRLDGIRILLAEDLPDNQFFVKKLLTMLGALVEIAEDGEEAITMASEHFFDVILMDIRMPKLGGLEATQELRRRGLKTPIISLTAHAMHDEIARFKTAGFDEHVPKPVSKEELIAAIHHVLRSATTGEM